MNANMETKPCAQVSEAEFEAVVLRSPEPVLVEFWAPWSRPCQILEAELGALGATCAGRAKVVRVNADENPDLSLWYGIQSIPTLLFFSNGMVQAKVVGTVSREAILAKLDAVKHPASANPPAPSQP